MYPTVTLTCDIHSKGYPPSRRVSEIAYAWGFNSIAHFSRVFRARYGMSPFEYRELHAVKGGR
ncbi:helix-turn-helix domain-containing protein [Pusillimonas noertemannii]|uniref:helix-turn-helix domain-containing protein n=1 Tax=Pusillimonas noertemannii TaxID=305977 RepID=UPI000374D3C8